MTMHIVRLEPDRVDVLSDTLTYSLNGANHGRATKARTFPHMDAVVLFQGSGRFSSMWSNGLNALRPTTFDELHDLSVQTLGIAHQEATRNAAAWDEDFAAVYQLGYSHRAERFVGVRYWSWEDFAPAEVPAYSLTITPTPLTDDDWAVPTTDAERVELAMRLRHEHAGAAVGMNKVLMGGDLIHTHLERGAVSQRRLHTFPEDDADWTALLSGTMHPLGQLGDCPCGKTEMYVDCCVAAALAETDDCTCDSGKPFGDCCRVQQALIDFARERRRQGHPVVPTTP